MIIALAAYPGSDIERISKLLALQLGIKYLSRDRIMDLLSEKLSVEREKIPEMLRNGKAYDALAELLKREAKNTHIVIDWLPAIWSSNASIKVFIYRSLKKRALERVKSEKIPLCDAENKLKKEHDMLQEILRGSGIEKIDDIKHYELAINADKLDAEGITSVIIRYIKNMRVE